MGVLPGPLSKRIMFRLKDTCSVAIAPFDDCCKKFACERAVCGRGNLYTHSAEQ